MLRSSRALIFAIAVALSGAPLAFPQAQPGSSDLDQAPTMRVQVVSRTT